MLVRTRILLKRPAVWWVSFAVWFAVLYVLSSVPGRGLGPPAVPFLDKILHTGYFFGGGIILCLALSLASDAPAWPRLALITVVTLAAVGAFDEWHQLSTRNRSGGDLADWIADLTGSILGTLFVARIAWRWLHRSVGPG